MFTIAEILRATGGMLLQGSLRLRLRGVVTDTRKVKKGELFIAIRGDVFDGHNYIAQAVTQGASAVIISRTDIDIPVNLPVIVVKDTVKAFGAIARYHRLKFNVPVIAITGSAGKTTTKEMIAAVLGKKYRVLYNKGTENNHMGVPLTLLRLTKAHKAAVIEAGTNHFGEIDWLGWVISPTVAIFTNIGQSHLEGLESAAGVYREKRTLIDHLSKNGTVILNADDPYLRKIAALKLAQRVITYGVDRAADLKVASVEPSGKGLKVILGRNRVIQLPAPVWGNVYNSLAAMACGQLLKIPFDDIAAALKRAKSARGRQCFHRVRGITLIDDTYNANPVSYQNAIRTLALSRGRGKVMLVAADMLELGDKSAALHSKIGAAAGRAGIDHILTLGPLAALIGKQAKKANPAVQVKHYARTEDMARDLRSLCVKGDVLLVKGSRGMHMERLVECLLKEES